MDEGLVAAATDIATEVGLEKELGKELSQRNLSKSKTMKTAADIGSELEDMKVSPRALVSSLEDHVPLPAEKLIGEGEAIDLSGSGLEPVSTTASAAPDRSRTKTQKAIDPSKLDPAPEPEPTAEPELAGSVADETGTAAADEPEPSFDDGSIQPLEMSLFERFALCTMEASEEALASIRDGGGAAEEGTAVDSGTDLEDPPTKQVSTVRGVDEIAQPEPPVEVGGHEVVAHQANVIPPGDVSPGLDEMVISSTNQTDFDLNDSEMVFSGNVQVKSPRFHLRADQFIVHLKSDNSGMSFGEAIGDVVIEMRENGQPTGYSGLASKAIYDPTEGKITLSGWPKIRQKFKEHVAVTRDTKMVLYTDGRVKTLGRNRTVIRK